MPSIINASTLNPSGLVQTADASGILQLQSNGTTGLTVGSGGLLTAANGMVMSSMSLSTPIAGELEYDGRVPYFTPQETQRGIIPGMQYYRLNSTLVGANATGAQSIFGVGVTLSSSTVYAFDLVFAVSKTAGVTSHNFQLLFGGTATVNNIAYTFLRTSSTTSFTDVSAFNGLGGYIQAATATSIVTNWTSAGAYFTVTLRGTVSVNAGGTFIPQYTLSAAPGGAYTIAVGSYFSIYPIGAAGSNISVGSWA